QGIEQCGSATTNPALRARLNSRLEHFVERDAAGMFGFAAADFTTQGADATAVDTDTSALRYIFDNSAGGGVDAVQTVAAFDQHARAELTCRRAYTRHDRCRQGNLELGYSVVKAFDVAQTCIGWILGEQAHCHQDVQKLGAFEDLFGNAILDEVLAFELFDGSVREVHVAPVVDIAVDFVELGFGVIGQQVLVVFAQLGQLAHMCQQMRGLEVTVGDFAQVEDGNAGSQVLVVWRIFGNKVGRRLDNGFVDVVCTNTVVELNMRAQLYLRDRYIIQTLGGPIDHAMDLVQINWLQATVTL